MHKLLLVLLFGIWHCSPPEPNQIFAPEWIEQNSGLDVSIRGICAVDAATVWISGQKGMFAFTLDGGDNWNRGKVPDADSLDFRDVEAFSKNMVYLMSAGPGKLSCIYKSTDGGDNWSLQHQNKLESGFYDGFAFWDEHHGILIGDPIDGKLYLLQTEDGGQHWDRIAPDVLPELEDGEYGFAASGTGITVFEDHVWIGTGGASARVFHSSDRGKSWDVFNTPISAGTASSGIFSIDFKDAKHGLIVGGDYTNPDQKGLTMAFTQNGGKDWILPGGEKQSFRSCVQFMPFSSSAVTIGRGGTSSYTNDDGLTWMPFGSLGLYTLSFSKKGRHAWAAGPNGRVAKLLFQNK